MIRRIALVITGAVVVLGLSACGERPQVIVFKQGVYQGKPDHPPFAGAPWNGNQQAWNDAIKVRNLNQNEYRRTGSSK